MELNECIAAVYVSGGVASTLRQLQLLMLIHRKTLVKERAKQQAIKASAAATHAASATGVASAAAASTLLYWPVPCSCQSRDE